MIIYFFSSVQSPDTVSSRLSPPFSKPSPKFPPSSRETSPFKLPSSHLNSPFPDQGHTPSLAEGINRGFASAYTLGSAREGEGPTFGGVHLSQGELGGGGKNLLDVMGSKFISNAVPTGIPVGKQSELFQNATVRNVRI